MYTEDEARQKWCPFARNLVNTLDEHGAAIGVGSANRFNNGRFSPCIASQCMAWRWAHAGLVVRNVETGEERTLFPGDSYRADKEREIGSARANTGYCGRAGRPE